MKFDETTGTIVSYLSDYDSVTIPPEFDEVAVRNIGKCAFSKKGIAKLKLPPTVKTIDRAAFCLNPIDTLVLPDCIENIGVAAFQHCGIRFLVLPQNIKHIADNAFFENSIPTFAIPPSLDTVGGVESAGLRKITVPSTASVICENAFAANHFDKIIIEDGVRKISSRAFDIGWTRTDASFIEPLPDDPHVDSLTIPSSVTDIGSMAFYCQRSIHTLILNEGLVHIGDRAFAFNQIDTLIIPSTVTRIGSEAFSSNGIDSLSLGGGITSLGDGAFASNHLRHVSIPPSLSELPTGCFRNNRLQEVDVPSSVNAIGTMCFAQNNIRSVNVSGSVSSIDSAAFVSNIELTSVTLGEGVTSIGPYAFAFCSDMSDESTLIRTLSLPSTLREIKPYAFYRTYITPTRLPQFNAHGTKRLTWYRYDGSKDNVLGEVETIGKAGFAHYDSELGFFAVESDIPHDPTGLNIPQNDDAADGLFSAFDVSGRLVRRGKFSSLNLPKGVYILRGEGGTRRLVVE
ncbi:MAG: leucine-rich repeat protein [Marinilabiliaceae bacterium]